MRVAVAVLMVAFLVACGPNVKAPVTVMALLYNGSNKLGPKQTTLDTVTNITALKGTVVNLVGGAGVTVNDPDGPDPFSLSDEELLNAELTSRGGDVHANLIDKGGVLWPADFHSWAMVTTYWNFEQSFNYFKAIYDGEKTDTLAGAQVLYWGNYTDLGVADPAKQVLTDNIIYFSDVRSFLFAPFSQLQKVPLAMNLGVVGHEFSHRVFNQKAFGNQAHPVELRWDGAPLNVVKGVDEGLADFHGWGVTCVAKEGPGCSTRYLALSFADEAAVAARDFSLQGQQNCMSTALRTAIDNLHTFEFQRVGMEYKLGTLIAAALYQAAEPIGQRDIMQKALIQAYDDDSTQSLGLRQLFEANLNTPENVTLEAVSDTILSHITGEELRRRACAELWDRLDLHPDMIPLPHCPNTATRGGTCPQ
ncbi:MAG: hypothetical protein IPJ65_17195 [Archangiaceae bacterium]|nr:hypothetical protein [Archangiaceae bacterium]